MTEEERLKFRGKYGITLGEEKPYVMLEEEDYEILAKVKKLEGKNLSDENRGVVTLIRSQLIVKWRVPLLEKLNLLLKKY